MAAHINLMERPTVNSDIPDAAAAEVDDQYQPLIIKKNQHLQQQQQQATPSSSVTSAALEDGSVNQDSSCQFYSQTNHKANERPIEPPKPEVLQGFVIPFLVDHAEWLGKREVFNGLALQYYITNYDFSGMRIDECLRKLCSHIFLRGESQVIDRLLVALSQRYAECNPDTRLRTADVAHAVTYSTLLLNTDLHIADIRSSDRMTKSRFVRNTVDTIAQFQQSSVVAPAVQRPVVADDISEDVDGGLSLPPQLPELDLAKQSAESAQATGADTPMSTSSRLLPGADSFDIGDSLSGPAGGSEQQSTLRSLVGSMASLSMSGSNNGGASGAGGASGNGTTGSRTSRDVVRLMGGRGKRFSFFDTSSAGGNPLAGPAAAAAASAAASSNNSSGTLSGSQTPNIGVGSSSTQLGAGQSSSRAFDRLRRKVSTNGTHVRTRSGTLSMDESPQPLNGRTSLSGSQHSHQQREGETLGSMVGRALSAAAGVTGSNNSGAGGSDSARARDAAAAANSNMPNLTELSSVLKDVYSGIKSKPLGQPPFARQASILYEQHQQQQQQMQMQNNAHYSMGHVLSRNSHDHMLNGNMRSSQAFGHGAGKQSMDVDANGRPSSVRSMPMHSVQRTRSITSINKAAAGGQGAGAMRRTPHHHADMRGVGFVPDAMKRSGSSMINFGTNGSNAGGNTVRSSPSAGSMGTGYTASTSFTTYLRSPIENQHIRSGVLVRKHLFERSGKKASHRAWRTCYVSVDRGTVAMYKMDGRHGAHPDGRELTDTSLQLGSVSLRHTMTHMLPSPGYSRSRPHVFALQLPSGGVYLFQTASEVELRDWVVACNYWAARESKAPYMIGGVYNMEYGWDNTGDFTLRFDEREAREDRGETLSATEQAAEQRRIMEEREASKGASILEWTPPNNPMQRSDQEEAGQLKALLHHISYLEDELVSHKKIQGSIEERFAPKTQIFHRAFSNWERKAQYILQELIKYQSYADVLQKALKQMQDELTLSIPEEGAAPGADGLAGFGAIFHGHGSSSAVGGGGSDDPSGDMVVAQPQQQAAGRLSSATSVTPLSGSRTSLPQTNNRRTNDANGNPAGSKSLPIKELLASASDKARNRASIIVPNSASSATTTGSSSLGMDKRRGSQPHVAAHRQSSGSTVSSPLPDNYAAAV
ncbi:hypothetical protein BX661DRAFT_173145 [Kickxella alabastrina]|uniref:uncharacterized protein n=1 Tax=Kickxella alabastrina TaxID=61397 RepID=UPI0022204693|nr:uncharacterized protein BX661DRAFT_173145 [Kickxella alabastrina]KAI7822087.1 hypothetical protein BX661DRAFT_173145 [Kickxella alabastrina]